MADEPTASKEWLLDPQTEYRFELDPGTSLAIKVRLLCSRSLLKTSSGFQLTRGHAEIFGFELVEAQTYVFGAECKAAVFTWQGCLLEMSPVASVYGILWRPNFHLPFYVTGRASTEYVSDETPMNAYGNLHIAFEQMRVRALAKVRDHSDSKDADPPRVLVLGPENSGKTSVCKILVNYAARAGQAWTPLLANVDPSEVLSLFCLCVYFLTFL